MYKWTSESHLNPERGKGGGALSNEHSSSGLWVVGCLSSIRQIIKVLQCKIYLSRNVKINHVILLLFYCWKKNTIKEVKKWLSLAWNSHRIVKIGNIHTFLWKLSEKLARGSWAVLITLKIIHFVYKSRFYILQNYKFVMWFFVEEKPI